MDISFNTYVLEFRHSFPPQHSLFSQKRSKSLDPFIYIRITCDHSPTINQILDGKAKCRLHRKWHLAMGLAFARISLSVSFYDEEHMSPFR